MTFTWRWPGQLLFGAGQLAALAREAPALGHRTMLCTTADLAAPGLAEHVERGLRMRAEPENEK